MLHIISLREDASACIMWGFAASVGFYITAIVERLWIFSDVEWTRQGKTETSPWAFHSVLTSHRLDEKQTVKSAVKMIISCSRAWKKKKNITMPSQKQMSDSPTLQPCTHSNSTLLLSSTRDMMVLSTTVTHSSEGGGGVSTACAEGN